MSIRYNLITVNAQKGPTCWYTAIEIMLRFHGRIIRHSVGAEADDWQQLKELRNIIIELALEKASLDYWTILNRIIRKLMITETSSPERERLRAIKNKFEKAKCTERFSIVDAFLPRYIKPVELNGSSYNAKFVENSLRAFGPLYASVYRPGASIFDMDYVRDPFPGQTGYVYSFDKNVSFGGLHAIVVYGIDDSGNVYYIDPSNPHRFCVISWGILQGQLNSPGGSMGDALFGRVNCDNCIHLRSRV